MLRHPRMSASRGPGATNNPTTIPGRRFPALDGDRVLGVVVDGEARAYPHNILRLELSVTELARALDLDGG